MTPESLRAAHPAVAGWIIERAPTFEFASSLLDQWRRKNYLSPGQIAAAQRCVDHASVARVEHVADYTVLETSFKRALAAGIKRPGLNVEGLRFTLAGASSANAGAIYVKTRPERGSEEEGQYLGKLMNGKFTGPAASDAALSKQVLDVAADPLGRAIAHGKTTGSCAICSRVLHDMESIARGIGPICAKRFFNA